ncbi:hypothetical protein J538_0044 [Acinetobacter sp. 272263]|nr:hypothetical protein J538_0044 [Acinetobacter sp. 272263]
MPVYKVPYRYWKQWQLEYSDLISSSVKKTGPILEHHCTRHSKNGA